MNYNQITFGLDYFQCFIWRRIQFKQINMHKISIDFFLLFIHLDNNNNNCNNLVKLQNVYKINKSRRIFLFGVDDSIKLFLIISQSSISYRNNQFIIFL